MNDNNITNVVQNMMITEVPVDSIHLYRIGCFGGEGQDTLVRQEMAGNELEVGVVAGQLHGHAPEVLEGEAGGEEHSYASNGSGLHRVSYLISVRIYQIEKDTSMEVVYRFGVRGW